MARLSTHVLDASRGRAAAGIAVRVEGAGVVLGGGVTDDDGRVADLGHGLEPGDYVVHFDTGAYLGADAFYPSVSVAFRITADEHFHVPPLLNPFGYSTYRGS